MILDRIENLDIYTNLSANIAAGFEYIKSTDLQNIGPGIYAINNEMTAIISEYETNNIEDCKLEAHEQYLDIQYLIFGTEQIGYTPLINQTPTIPYNKDNDVVFYQEEVALTTLDKGMFAIYFPTDLHMPGVKFKNKNMVKKLVIKIPV